MTGHEAVALGAMVAGCKFVAGYPMTPTTTILEYIADKGRQFNVPVVQAEDEISAANMVVGAAYAGVRAMTATSGGGFCLMVEALSLAAMTETPMVVVLGQRPGPAIGLPTKTEQGELEFALYGGHGGFPRPVLAPGGVADAFWLTLKAFNMAERYQTPVILITDHDLADSYNTVESVRPEGRQDRPGSDRLRRRGGKAHQLQETPDHGLRHLTPRSSHAEQVPGGHGLRRT